jgi:hypothetical protein
MPEFISFGHDTLPTKRDALSPTSTLAERELALCWRRESGQNCSVRERPPMTLANTRENGVRSLSEVAPWRSLGAVDGE